MLILVLLRILWTTYTHKICAIRIKFLYNVVFDFATIQTMLKYKRCIQELNKRGHKSNKSAVWSWWKYLSAGVAKWTTATGSNHYMCWDNYARDLLMISHRVGSNPTPGVKFIIFHLKLVISYNNKLYYLFKNCILLSHQNFS